MADQLPALVVLDECRVGATVDKAFHHTRLFSHSMLRDGNRTLLIVEPGVAPTTPRIPERTGQPHLIQQTQLPPGIDAVRQQRLPTQAVARSQVRLRRRAPQPRVPGFDQATCRVKALPGDAWINHRAIGVAAITDAADRKDAWIDDRQRGCRGMGVHCVVGPSL
ncbi:hypothetical protein D3C76_617510 [compost metagenome]